jgi:rRNA maturation endonuclease Nob1
MKSSFYRLTCLCGREFDTSLKNGVCPWCGVEFEIRPAEVTSKPVKPTITARYEAEENHH